MTDQKRELRDVLAVRKMDSRPGGEVKFFNSYAFKNPKLEGLFLKSGEMAHDNWTKVTTRDIRDLLVEEIGLQEDGDEVDYVGLKELFIKRLRKVIDHYDGLKKSNMVGHLNELVTEL